MVSRSVAASLEKESASSRQESLATWTRRENNDSHMLNQSSRKAMGHSTTVQPLNKNVHVKTCNQG